MLQPVSFIFLYIFQNRNYTRIYYFRNLCVCFVICPRAFCYFFRVLHFCCCFSCCFSYFNPLTQKWPSLILSNYSLSLAIMTQYLPPKSVCYSFPETTSTVTETEVSERTHHDPVSSSSNKHSLLYSVPY
jgi:hypothetical protein